MVEIQDNAARVKHTVLWRPDDWNQVIAALGVLADEQQMVVRLPDFIRGAVLARCAEVLRKAA